MAKKMKLRNKITLVYAYYENGGMLDRHLEEWESYSERYKRKINVILVDDGSPKDPAISHITKDIGIPIKLFRIKEDIPWNQNGARNLAMKHASGWCLLTDMDHLLTADQVPTLLTIRLKYPRFFIPLRRKAITHEPYKRHPNSYIIHSQMYWKIGGFDEAYAGYYGTDSTFRRRLGAVGQRVSLQNITLTLFGREVIPDASTTIYGRKGSEYHVSQNLELASRKKACPPPISPLNFEWEQLL